MWHGLALLVGFSFLAGPALPAATTENGRTALVIGNARYEPAFGRLRNAGNDAAEMARVLRGLGFRVLERKDVTREQLLAAVEEFRRTLHGADVAVFFYAGHGLSVAGANYLVPLRSGFEPETLDPMALRLHAESRLFNAEQAVADMAAGGAACNIVILDACRTLPTGALRTRGFAPPTGLAEMTPPAGSLIAFSADRGQVAFDGDGANGLFTEELLRQLMTPGLSIEQVFKRTRAAVVRRSGGAQVPAEYSRLVGDDVILRPRASPVVGAIPAVEPGDARPPAPLSLPSTSSSAPPSQSLQAIEAVLEEMKSDLRDASSPSPKVVRAEQAGRDLEEQIPLLLPDAPERNRLLAKAANRRGDALLLLGRAEQALECFQRAAKWDPEDAYILYNRGRAYLQLGQIEEAKSDFNSAAGPRYEQPGARRLALEALRRF